MRVSVLARAFLARRPPRSAFNILLSIHHMRARRAGFRRARFGRGKSRARAPREFNMPNKMIIDASHPEETRVVVLRGNRVEEFDFESANKKPLRGNIYLAKVTRVEPSLQAAFVDYGGNRHGFLAFSEIHPDYYQIPIADRQALLEEEARSHRDDDEEPKGERRSRRHRRPRREAELRAPGEEHVSEAVESTEAEPSPTTNPDDASDAGPFAAPPAREEQPPAEVSATPESAPQGPVLLAHDAPAEGPPGAPDTPFRPLDEEPTAAPVEALHGHDEGREHESGDAAKIADRADPPPFIEPLDEDEEEDEDELEVTTLDGGAEERAPRARRSQGEDEGEAVEQVGGDAMEEMPRRAPRLRRQYKIQEVIKRRQVLLVQVVKEERGNKGAALTTYLSLAGRYSVLMPNTARGGGISRKITNTLDRSRLKSIAQDLEVPEGMGVILRTAGASRTKAEVKRDFEYLLRMWETVRELTLSSSAPTLVYEEGSLIKRAIRDLYDKDVEEVVVAGEEGYREAKEFMRLLMPSHAKNVQPYRDLQPVFARAGVEAQLDAMFSNQVTLKSGGYIVINQTEALVAIDVNSGRSTREHNIEDTALRTNLEAADEIARQLRLRDLAGLIVLDLIDMEESRNNRAVERRLKDALKNDRARIQVGRISHFGLLEMSRQRIRTGVLEGSTVVCPHCMGGGVVRSTASIALHVLRVLEDALIKSATHNMTVRTRTEVALYILNQKRRHLRDLERRFGVTVMVAADETLTGLVYHALERGEPASGVVADETAPRDFAIYDDSIPADEEFEDEASPEGEAETEHDEADAAEAGEDQAEARARRPDAGSGASVGEDGETVRRRRRRRRRRGERGPPEGFHPDAPQPTDAGLAAIVEIGGDLPSAATAPQELAEDSEPGEGERPSELSGRHRRGRGPRRGDHERGRGRRFESARETEGQEPSALGATIPNASSDEGDASGAGGGPPEAARSPAHLPPSAVHESVADGPVFHDPEAPQPREQSDVAANASANGESSSRSDTTAPDEVEDSSRPKRSGWWRRARATLVGE
jgi:ribonuclease E